MEWELSPKAEAATVTVLGGPRREAREGPAGSRGVAGAEL